MLTLLFDEENSDNYDDISEDFMIYADTDIIRKQEIDKLIQNESLRMKRQGLGENLEFDSFLNQAISKIANIPYQKISVELTPLFTLIFRLELKKHVSLLLTLSLKDKKSYDPKVAYNLYVNRDCIVRNFKPLSEVISGAIEVTPQKIEA
jgi:hypothetical protein